VTDRSGENELAVRAADGRAFKWANEPNEVEERQLTKLGGGYAFRPTWSPDSKCIVFATHDGAIHRVTLADGAHEIVDTDPDGQPLSCA
jgi:Tol biopolymer transport system component